MFVCLYIEFISLKSMNKSIISVNLGIFGQCDLSDSIDKWRSFNNVQRVFWSFWNNIYYIIRLYKITDALGI